MKRDKENSKATLKWVLKLIVIHLFALILFAMLKFDDMMRDLQSDSFYSDIAHRPALFFGLAFVLLFCVYLAVDRARYVEYRTNLVNAIKAGGFSLFSYFRGSFLLDCAKKSAVYAAFQLPFALFYFFFGFDAFYTTGIEKFYALEAGLYLWMDSAILGMVLSVTLFFVCSSCADFILLVINYRYVMENTPTLSEMK